MQSNPICKICGHSFQDHKFSEYGLTWWCEVDGEECPCESFVIDENSREEQYNNYYLN